MDVAWDHWVCLVCVEGLCEVPVILVVGWSALEGRPVV